MSTAWSPLRHGMFRMLWIAWLTANISMWMNELAAAWLMTTLSNDPVLVGLVRTAATLPGFLLAVPSGAVADIVDRRRWFMGTQLWVTIVAAVLALAVWTGAISPPLLLMLVLAYGAGLALRWPVYAAIVPDLVPRHELAQAVALNGVSANASRIIGPVIAGAVLAWLGSAWVFALNAVLSIGSAAVIWRWRPTPRASALPGERFLGAMRVGLQYAAQSPPLRAVLLQTVVFFLHTTALLALLPFVVKRLQGGEAMYTVLMVCMSVGAIATAALAPRWRGRLRARTVVRAGAVIYAAAAIAAAYAPNKWVAVLAMLPAGAAWIAVSNVLTTCAQLALPDWVRARGMSLYLMSVTGGNAAGAALWGTVARYTGVPASLAAASVVGLVLLVAMRRLQISDHSCDDLKPIEPSPEWLTPPAGARDAGPVMVTIEYVIDPPDEAEFTDVMKDSRRSRLRGGALSWGLLRDAADSRRYVEYFVDENWVEHARRLERLTAGDARVRARRLALHKGSEPPKVSRYVGQTVSR